jgi:hypothetical protein
MTYYPLTAICLLPIKDKNQVRLAIPAFHKREMPSSAARNALKADFLHVAALDRIRRRPRAAGSRL